MRLQYIWINTVNCFPIYSTIYIGSDNSTTMKIEAGCKCYI